MQIENQYGNDAFNDLGDFIDQNMQVSGNDQSNDFYNYPEENISNEFLEMVENEKPLSYESDLDMITQENELNPENQQLSNYSFFDFDESLLSNEDQTKVEKVKEELKEFLNFSTIPTTVNNISIIPTTVNNIPINYYQPVSYKKKHFKKIETYFKIFIKRSINHNILHNCLRIPDTHRLFPHHLMYLFHYFRAPPLYRHHLQVVV